MKYFILLFTLFIHGCFYTGVYAQSYFKGPALIEGVTQVSTTGGTTTLTKGSQTVQSFIGTLTQTVQLPDATTLPLGRYFELYNDSTDAVTVNNNGSNVVHTVRPSTSIKIIVKDVSTSNGGWIIQKIDNSLPAQAGNTGKYLTTNGTDTSWADVDALPAQAGNTGKYLTTNGTDTSWADVDALPAQAGNTGKYLTTNGTDTSWADVDALPAQAGNTGKYLTTNGTDTSWADVDALPAQAGNTGKYLNTNGTDTSWADVTLQPAYLGSSQPQITLNSTQGGVLFRDASTPIGTTLFAIQNNVGTSSYLGVDANGLSTTNFTGTGTTGAIRLHNLTTAQGAALTDSIGNIWYDTDLRKMRLHQNTSRDASVITFGTDTTGYVGLTGGDTVFLNVYDLHQTILVAGASGRVSLDGAAPFGYASTRPNGLRVTLSGTSDANAVTIPANDTVNTIVGYSVTLGRSQSSDLPMVFDIVSLVYRFNI